MRPISWMWKEPKKHQQPGTIFWQSGSAYRWKDTRITLLMRKRYRIKSGIIGNCRVPLEDLSQGDDFCSFTFLFPLSNGSFGVKTRNYITELTLKKLPAAIRMKYDQFIAEGSLIVMPGTVLDMMEVYEDLDNHIAQCDYDVRCFGYDPYNAKDFVARWESENGPFGIEKVIQGAKTESVPLGELKKLSEERMLLFDEELMTFAMGNCIVMEDTNGNRKLLKKRYDAKIDAVAAMMDAFVAYKLNREAFD